jgi:hypothetical protein
MKQEWKYVAYEVCLFFDLENGGYMLLRNVG